MLRYLLAVGMVLMLSAACASTPHSDADKARVARVRVVNSTEFVRGCQPIGSVTDDDIEDLQKKAARLGGDVAVVTLQQQRTGASFGAYGGAFRMRTYTTAEVYRCSGAQ
jgi:starvation-inducible outer membrane lipoprotein